MGISIFGSSCSHGSDGYTQPRLPNPNPRKFVLNSVIQVGKFVVAQITYPDCTNYEGDKILVFEGVTPAEVKQWKEIDPHFCNAAHKSPVARFEPTLKGLRYAIAFCRAV